MVVAERDYQLHNPRGRDGAHGIPFENKERRKQHRKGRQRDRDFYARVQKFSLRNAADIVSCSRRRRVEICALQPFPSPAALTPGDYCDSFGHLRNKS